MQCHSSLVFSWGFQSWGAEVPSVEDDYIPREPNKRAPTKGMIRDLTSRCHEVMTAKGESSPALFWVCEWLRFISIYAFYGLGWDNCVEWGCSEDNFPEMQQNGKNIWIKKIWKKIWIKIFILEDLGSSSSADGNFPSSWDHLIGPPWGNPHGFPRRTRGRMAIWWLKRRLKMVKAAAEPREIPAIWIESGSVYLSESVVYEYVYQCHECA